MARYCFYCGRELADGEKCHCREQTYVTGARDGSPDRSDAGTSSGSRSREGYAASGASAGYSGNTSSGPASHAESSSAPSKKSRWQTFRENQDHKRAEREARRRAKARQQQAKKEQRERERQNARQSNADYRSRPGDSRQMLRQFVGFILAPADAMEATLSPYWSPSHTIWLVLSLLLSGLAYVNFYRVVVFLVSGSVVAMSAGRFFLSWLTGIALTGAVLLLNTLTIWLISRFMFHQGRLPFTHALAAGRTSWKYLVLFLVIALPSTFSPGSLFGLVLAGIGIIFSIILHGRLVARLTRLDDNRTIQLILLSMLVFAGLSSTALLVFNLSMV